MSTITGNTVLPHSPTSAAANPAPVAAPAPVSSPSPAVKAPGAGPVSQKVGTSTPGQTRRPTVDPTKALGLPEAPRDTIANLVKASRTKNKLDTSFEAAPAPAAHPASTPVTPAAPTPPVPAAPAAEPAPAPVPEVAAPVSPQDALIAKLQKDIDDLKKPKETAPAPTPAAAAPVEIPETPEQVAARQNDWVQTYSEHVPAEMTSEQLDAILAGGPEAVATMQNLRRTDIARGVLEARTSIYKEINPVVQELRQGLGVLLRNHMDVQRFTIENQFFTKYPDLQEQRDYCNQMADYLLQTYPQECAKLQPEQFIDHLQGQVMHGLDTQAKRLGFGSWSEAKGRRAPVAPAPAAPGPLVLPAGNNAPTHLSAPGPTGPTSIGRPAMPTTAPSANPPGAAPISAGTKSWGASVAADLRN